MSTRSLLADWTAPDVFDSEPTFQLIERTPALTLQNRGPPNISCGASLACAQSVTISTTSEMCSLSASTGGNILPGSDCGLEFP